MLEKIFFDIVDDAMQIETYDQGDILLKTIKDMYGLSHVAYLGVNIPGAKKGRPIAQCTYSDSWKKHYLEQKFHLIDPVVLHGLTNLMPQDWKVAKEQTKQDNKVQQLFNEASEFGIGSHGVTFPIRGKYGDVGIFCVNSNLKEKEWNHIKKICMRDFLTFANFFHNGVLKSTGNLPSGTNNTLSPREIEVLQWASAGKSAWDTAKIMNISERTIKFHLTNARTKLNCLTTTQAVACAISQNIIAVH